MFSVMSGECNRRFLSAVNKPSRAGRWRVQNNEKRIWKIRCEPLQPSPHLRTLFVWLRSVLIVLLFVPRFSKWPFSSCLASKICICFFRPTYHFYHPNNIKKNKNCMSNLIDVRKMAWLCKVSDFSTFLSCTFFRFYRAGRWSPTVHGALGQTVSVATYCFMSQNYYIAFAIFSPCLPVHM